MKMWVHGSYHLGHYVCCPFCRQIHFRARAEIGVHTKGKSVVDKVRLDSHRMVLTGFLSFCAVAAEDN